MINNELPSLSPELAERIPNCIGGWLRRLWIEHTGSLKCFVTEPAWLSRPQKEYSEFSLHNYEIMLALECLHKSGAIKNAELIIKNGQLRENVSDEEWQIFVNQAPLKKLKIGVIGGPEARIFSAMGASAVGFDPHLNKLSLQELPQLKEHSVYLTKQLAQKYANRFDLTLSSWLFDQGSGLSVGDFRIFNDILQMTKPGGFSIHNGNLMPMIVQKLSLVDEVLKIIPSNSNYKLGDSPVYFVLQKS